jgi:predicted AAA+ superfamily ATPase
VDSKTIANYLDLMVDLLLVRRLMPWHRNAGKRNPAPFTKIPCCGHFFC